MTAQDSVKKIFCKDTKSTYLWCNQQYAKDFGLIPKQIYGKTDFDLYPKKIAQKYIKDDKKVIKSGHTIDIIEEYKTKKSLIYVHTIKTASRDSQGKINGLVGIFWDTSQENKLHQAMVQSQKQFEAITESTSDAIIIMDHLGKVSFWSQSAQKMFGYSTSQIIGKSLHRLITVDKSHRNQKNIINFGKTGKSKVIGRSIELVVKNKQGKKFPIELTVSSTLIDGKWSAVGIVRDISRRLKRQNRLKRMSSIIENSQDAIIGKTLDGTVTSWNTGAQLIYGYSKSDIVGKNINKIIPKQYQHELKNILSKVSQGKSIENLKTKRLTKHGQLLDVSLTISPIYDSHAKVVGASTIGRDITKEIIEQNKVKEYQFQLEKINRLLVGRELKMIQLKDRIKKLESGLGSSSTSTKLNWSQKFQQAIDFEDDIILTLQTTYLDQINKSNMSQTNKKTAKRFINHLIKDSQRHEFMFNKLIKAVNVNQ